MGPKVRKAKWMWQSVAGSEADALKVEYEVGQDLACEVRQQLGPGRNDQTNCLLNEIGRRLAAYTANKFRKFTFEIVEGTESNAFALPGGFVFVTQLLVELCGHNPDEVAFVLGHEMGHIVRGHAMNRIISTSAIAAVSRAAPVQGVLAGWLRRVGVQFVESAYSQDMETEADRFGVQLAAAAGYEPQACVQLFCRLAELKTSARQIDLGSYFSSHPPFDVRIRNVNRLLHKLRQDS
jgi:predicted Zn-dependent protease